MNYQSFDNYLFSVEAHSARFILQDNQGLIWAGTNKGLYSFDGYRAFPHFTPGSTESRLFHCGLFYQSDYLLLGTEKGLLKFDCKRDRYVPFEADIDKDIRNMVLTGEDLWLGCADGLFRYHFRSKTLQRVPVRAQSGRSSYMINALLEDEGFVYVGASGLLGRISLSDYSFEPLEGTPGGWLLVTALLKDHKRNCIWIGEGNSITRYSPASGSFERITGFPVVKSVSLDGDQNVVVGTDNGLYVHTFPKTEHAVHNTLRPHSLANNVVWCVFRDQSDNIWLGTDLGISMAPRQRPFDFVPLYEFSGTGDGNQFYSVFRDSWGSYWLGGDNGLICTRTLKNVDSEFRWYRMGTRPYSIPHNRIRDIFEDRQRTLWIATDFGVCRYDYTRDRISTFFISNRDGSRNAHWVYDFLEDESGYLWMASFNGGVFKVDKKRCSGFGAVVADAHFSTENGLTSNNIDKIEQDRSGNIWALNRNQGLDIIHTSNGKVSHFPLQEYTLGQPSGPMIKDAKGVLWIGFRNGVVRIDPDKQQAQSIQLADADNAMIQSLLEVEDNIWIISTEGLWVIDKAKYTVCHVSIANRYFYSAFYDEQTGNILLGGTDGIGIFSSRTPGGANVSPRIMISSVLLNGKPYPLNDQDSAVRFRESIGLPYRNDNITVEFSDLTYSKGYPGRAYVYKLKDTDEHWTSLNASERAIHLNQLTPGKYTLTIAAKSPGGGNVQVLKTFRIVIHPPWYFSWPVLFVYALLLGGLVVWSINFFNQRHKLRIARIDREKTLEQTRMKIDFFTNIAHEFKTPLSLIIAPLSRLLQDKGVHEKEVLEMMHQNAMKLNALVQQAIEYYREDSEGTAGVVLSRVDLVEFARSMLTSYESNMKDAQLEFVFSTQPEIMFVDVDVLKMESIIGNLLSNACKYTPSGGSVLLSLKYIPSGSMVELMVSDSGVGIPERDLPYVFQRFFQSPAHRERGGTGIGLYLVKRFSELHGGTVHVVSHPEEGTSFVVRLPLIVHQSGETSPADASAIGEPGNKPLMLIVEDHASIAGFIQSIFSSDFRCVIAHNGKVGLKICTDLMPDMIIADIMMPVMDGLEMCRRIKENVQTSAIPIIMLTAKDDRETELDSIHSKVDAFIPKPFDVPVLVSRVHQLLETRKLCQRKMRIEELTTPGAEAVPSEDEKFLAAVTRTIEEQLANPDFNVSMLSESMNVAQKQLYRRVKALTGMTPVNYIRSIRMKKAAILLTNKNFTVSEVMYRVGFSNHSYFARCFHAEFGVNPSQFGEGLPVQ